MFGIDDLIAGGVIIALGAVLAKNAGTDENGNFSQKKLGDEFVTGLQNNYDRTFDNVRNQIRNKSDDELFSMYFSAKSGSPGERMVEEELQRRGLK